ncbi:hypothetical protein Tco_1573136, partial [Tanacetum coccineum]
LFAEVHAMKTKVDLIKKRGGDVDRSFLDKELDDVRKRILNDNVILEVFHHDVSCDTVVPIVGHGESSDSQDYSPSSMSQLLQVVINEKPGPVVDSTQMVVDNRIDLDDILGFENQYEQVAKKGDEGLVKQDDMLVLEEGVNRLDYGKEENDESEKTQEKVFVDVKIYYVQSFKKPW